MQISLQVAITTIPWAEDGLAAALQFLIELIDSQYLIKSRVVGLR